MALKEFLYRHVTAIDIVSAILILVLVMTNVYSALKVDQLKQEIENQTANQEELVSNTVYAAFMNLFINQVLRAEGEISFETRLKLESDVRALDDEEVLLLWQNFTNSQTEDQAQEAVKVLLGILIERIQNGP